MPSLIYTEAEVREAIEVEAKSWIHTPYHDHAGIKGAGVDCAYYPLRVYQAVGLIEEGFKVPYYSPQQWLNNPSQTDKYHLKFEDTTMLDIVKKLTKREIKMEEAKKGDFMLCLIAASWTHGAIIIDWPGMVLHPVKGMGVIGSHGINEGFWGKRPKRFFSMF